MLSLQALAQEQSKKRSTWNQKFMDTIHYRLLRSHSNFLQVILTLAYGWVLSVGRKVLSMHPAARAHVCSGSNRISYTVRLQAEQNPDGLDSTSGLIVQICYQLNCSRMSGSLQLCAATLLPACPEYTCL